MNPGGTLIKRTVEIQNCEFLESEYFESDIINKDSVKCFVIASAYNGILWCTKEPDKKQFSESPENFVESTQKFDSDKKLVKNQAHSM